MWERKPGGGCWWRGDGVGSGFGSQACRHSSAFCLPTALPLMNGYSSYEQHHSGKAAPLLGSGLRPSNASLGLSFVCVVAEGSSGSAPHLGGRLCSGFGRSCALLSIHRVCTLSKDTSCLLSCGCGPGTGSCPGMLGSAATLVWGNLPTAREVWRKGRRRGVQYQELSFADQHWLSAGEDVL